MSVVDLRPTHVRWTRSSRGIAALALGAIALLTVLLWSTQTALGALAMWLLGALVGLDSMRNGYFAAGPGTFHVAEGALHVKSGRSTWTVRGENLVGASTSRGEGGWELTLQARGSMPFTLEGLDEDSVQRICEVLGIGSAGFGELALRPRSGNGRVGIATMFGLMGGYMLFFFAVAVPVGAYGAMILPFATLLLLTGMGRRQSVVTLSDAGVGILWGARPVTIPWQAITAIQREPNALVLTVADQQVPVVLPIRSFFIGDSLSPTEANLVERQVEAALERSRGLGRPRRIDVTGTSELLARGNMPTVEWHAHLDRLAAEMAHGGGYRSVRIDRDVLHQVLSNPDAEPLARIGAARVLARVEGGQVRERIEIARGSLHSEEDIVAFESALAETELLEAELQISHRPRTR